MRRKEVSSILKFVTYIMIISGILLSFLYFKAKSDVYTHVAKVNGVIIPVREFRQQMLKNRLEVIIYFKQKRGVDVTSEFWNSSYDGEKPVEMLKKTTLNQLIKIKVEQLLAKREGLIKQIKYTSFLKHLEKENRKRKKDYAENRVIFGPEQYGEAQYYDYLHSNMVIKLKKKLASKELSITENDIKRYYEANPSKSEMDHKTFEDLEDFVRVSLIDEKYEELLNQLVKQVKVEINKYVYNNLIIK